MYNVMIRYMYLFNLHRELKVLLKLISTSLTFSQVYFLVKNFCILNFTQYLLILMEIFLLYGYYMVKTSTMMNQLSLVLHHKNCDHSFPCIHDTSPKNWSNALVDMTYMNSGAFLWRVKISSTSLLMKFM